MTTLNAFTDLIVTTQRFFLAPAILVLIFTAIVGYLAFRQLQRFVSPNSDRLVRQLKRLSMAQPTVSRESHVRRIIAQQAFKCGLVGAITGIGGFITFPIALPIDLILSMRIQATLVQFIALTYGYTPSNSMALTVQTRLITTGSVEVSERTVSVIMKFVTRLLGESLSLLIPAIGALVGFAVNYGIAQTSGQVALRWYTSRSAQPANRSSG